MSLFNRQSTLKRRSSLRSNASPRRAQPWSRFIPQFIELEDRCVMAAPTLTGTVGSLSQVFSTTATAGLTPKFVTILNNSNDMVYPILFAANSTIDQTVSTKLAATIDATTTQITITSTELFPIVGQFVIKIDGERMLVTNGPGSTGNKTWTVQRGFGGDPTAAHNGNTDVFPTDDKGNVGVSLYDPLDPYNQTYRGYIGEFNASTGQTELGLKPHHHLTIQIPFVFWDGGRLFFAYNGSQPLNVGDPGDPLQNNSKWHFNASAPSFLENATSADPGNPNNIGNPNGKVLWYHDGPLPFDFGTDGPGQLAEWTIRDPAMGTYATHVPILKPDQLVEKVFNYDVSYVDNLTLPAAMEVTNVPIRTPPDYNGPAIPNASYAWLGTDLTIPQMQSAMVDFIKTVPGVDNGDLGKYFGGRGYDQFYFPPNSNLGPKLPAGYNLIALAPNALVTSTFDATKFQLTSGGNFVSVPTNAVSGQGTVLNNSNEMTALNPLIIEQLAVGMLIDNPTIFTKGTAITAVDTVNNKITLSSNSLIPGPAGLAYTFRASQFVSTTGNANGTTTLSGLNPDVGIELRTGMLVTGPGIAPNTTITVTPGVYNSVTLSTAAGTASPVAATIAASPNGAVYNHGNVTATITTTAPHNFTPGQWVTISGVANAAYNGTFKLLSAAGNQFTYVNPNGTATLQASGGGSVLQPYSFVGGPSSYVVQTLINNWYMWADYYVKHVDLSGLPVMPVAGSINATKVPTNGTDENAVILTLASTTGLKVGMVVNGPGIVPIVNTRYPANEVNRNLSPNTTIAEILGPTSVRLSNPVLTQASGNYSFSAPQPIGRSQHDTPVFNPSLAAGLSFATGTAAQQDFAVKFAQSVYNVMQGWSHLTEPSYLSQSALLLNYVIGGNIGTFVLQDINKNTGIALPNTSLNLLRDELKAVLRGVPDFGLFQESTGLWYPDPSVNITGGVDPRGNAQISGAAPTFGVYNLNPYVWFIHVKLGMSGYGFSLDDDTANAQDRADSVQAAFGGTQKLTNQEQFTYGAPFGRVTDTGGFIYTTKPGLTDTYPLNTYTIIGGLSVATVEKIKVTSPKDGPGPLVFGNGVPAGSRVGASIGIDPNDSPVHQSFAVLGSKEHPLPSPYPANSPPIVGTYVFAGFSTTVPKVDSFSPPSGAVGATVTLTGSGFTNAKGVTFNGLPGTILPNGTDSVLMVQVPMGATSGPIGVRGPAGTGYSTANFTVTGSAPPVFDPMTPFTPANGSLGSVITLKGTGFAGVTGVTFFNGTPATHFQYNPADGTISATVPVGASTGPVVVTTPVGSSAPANFTVNAPNITAFTPTSGPIGTHVVLTGTGFTGANALPNGVTFNGVNATSFTVVNDTTINATVPAGTPIGAGLIAVTTSAGTGNTSALVTPNFTVTVAAAPVISAFTPTTGPVGTVVTITGTGFTGANTLPNGVTFNGLNAASVSVINDTTIEATVPTGATTGLIAVTTPAGSGNTSLLATPNFTVSAPAVPTITSFTPAHGLQGTPVTLTGTGFTGATDVSFNGVSTGFIVANDTTITTHVPAGATTGFISVTTAHTGLSLTQFVVDDAINTATHFGISAPADAIAGNVINVTVTALDSSNNPTSTYGGTVTLSSIPGFSSVLPGAVHTFVPSDNGSFTFQVIFTGAGNKAITAAEVPNVTPMSPASTTVTISDVVTSLSNHTVGEQKPVGTLVGALSSTPSGTYTYQLASGGDNASFTIAGNQLLSGAIFNSNVKSQYQITVKTFQGATEVASTPFTISIVNVAKRVAFVAAPKDGLPLRGFDAAGNQLFELVPFAGYTGNVAVALGDVNGDLVPDLVVSTVGIPARVKVFNGTTLATTPVELVSFQAFGQAGGFVAVGDINNDQFADIIVSQNTGAARIRVYNGANAAQGNAVQIADINAFPSGGVRVAVGDFNGDSRPDVIAANSGTANKIKVFDGIALAAGTKSLLASVESFAGGSYVSAGDFNHDNRADIVAGKQSGNSKIKVYNAANPSQVLLNFDAVPGATVGARVAVTDLNGDSTPDIVAALPNGNPEVLGFDGNTGHEILDKNITTGYSGGFFVAGNGRFGSPLHLQSGPGSGAANLTGDQLAPVVAEAIHIFADAGLSSLLIDQLENVDIQVADLGGSTLGLAYANTIRLDANAAGHGWSLDDSVGSHEVDLLSVLVHEFGHVLGLDHDAGFMDDLLELGERRLPAAAELDELFSGSGLD